jgi:Holliday junction resolvasome RuvABC endonuclease subunit
MRIIGIDPGQTTGIAIIESMDEVVTVDAALHMDGIGAARALGVELTLGPAEVVVERFNIAHRTLLGTRQGTLETLYTIGAVRYVCAEVEIPLTFQEPAAAKRAFNDDVIRGLGLWSKTSGPHERDALRHALLHARTQGFWRGTL